MILLLVFALITLRAAFNSRGHRADYDYGDWEDYLLPDEEIPEREPYAPYEPPKPPSQISLNIEWYERYLHAMQGGGEAA